jgi:hypothetical protein
VKVTDCPTFDGFCAEAKVVVDVALLATCFTAIDVLLPKFEKKEALTAAHSTPLRAGS